MMAAIHGIGLLLLAINARRGGSHPATDYAIDGCVRIPNALKSADYPLRNQAMR